MKKLEDNGMWESSRMMLPQHKEALLKQQKSWDMRPRPVMDDQELELISRAIGEALQSKSIVTITVHGEYEDREVVGQIARVDPFAQTIRISSIDGTATVPIYDVLSIYSISQT